ncbi:uncharacterized protein LOC105385048 [Plutella xylostella]|uniref:uncharacterized protein LOC105385048 n=1 Tax=Plutella xylostella TaxID=51655 RepID=UPI002032400D|nr:uncharacterized protein LOC105385048 [Plutella xylostella]
MPHHSVDGPVYYREIQKNAYLKRIPNESTSKLRPLSHKKAPLKAMWTQFCVHNGRIPYLEQYPSPECQDALTHRPLWRACLTNVRHVTASVTPHVGKEHDFFIHTEEGPLRMLAPDWHSMQDWVTSLRSKLVELQMLQSGENVYCGAPAGAVPRAAARDPTSPLPPTPPHPPHRVPGIEIITPPSQLVQNTQPPSPPVAETTEPIENSPSAAEPANPEPTEDEEPVDISDWDSASNIVMPSTSQEKKPTESNQPKKSVAKICGQNICLDDSILKRRDSDYSSQSEDRIDRLDDSVEESVVESIDSNVEDVFVDADKKECKSDFKQTLVVNSETERVEEASDESSHHTTCNSEFQGTNITVIQVSNKGPPHTAIPIIGPETDVFNFDIKPPSLTIDSEQNGEKYVNIVNTETDRNTDNKYGTVFTTNESDYGHLSLTTTVNLTGSDSADVNPEGIYERLCMATTSNEKPSPLPVRKLQTTEKARKSSLPNLESNGSTSTYEYLYPGSNAPAALRNVNLTAVSVTSASVTAVNSSQNVIQINSRVEASTTEVPSASRILSPRLNNNNNSANVSVNPVGGRNVNPIVRGVRANVERSHSQNAYDVRLRDRLPRQNSNPKTNGKSDKSEPAPPKPLWKRGLTEFSLLSRLRGLGQGKRADSPTRCDRSATTVVKVVRRSRPDARQDNIRKRSNSLTNGVPPTILNVPREVAKSLLFFDYENQVWLATSGRLCGAGDRVAAVAGRRPAHAAHAGALVNSCPHRVIDILVHRVPLAKIYVLRKEREDENLGIKLLQDCTVSSVAPASAAARAAVPRGWSLTEVNHTPLNLIKVYHVQDCTVLSVAPASAAARAAVPRGWGLTEVNHTPLKGVSKHGVQGARQLRAAFAGHKFAARLV